MLNQEKKQIMYVLCLTDIDNSVETARGSGAGGWAEVGKGGW